MITLHPAKVGRHSARSICNDQVVKAHGVIPINCALESLRKDHFQIPVSAGYERGTSLRCRNRKTLIELSDVVIVEEAVGRFQCSDPSQGMCCNFRGCWLVT